MAGAGAVGAISLALLQHQIGGLPLLTTWISSISEDIPHSYSFKDGNRVVEGNSTSKFVARPEYSARLEYCQQFTTDAAAAVVTACYITLRPKGPLVVTNVRNATEAVFSDGSRASVCCMKINDNGPYAASPFPAGFIGFEGTYQRSFEKGDIVQIVTQMPSLKPDLDVIYFSPGNHPETVTLPAADYIDRVNITKAMVARLGDTKLRGFIEHNQRFEAEIRENQRLHSQAFGN